MRITQVSRVKVLLQLIKIQQGKSKIFPAFSLPHFMILSLYYRHDAR